MSQFNKRLDRSRPYGEHYGAGCASKYEQDGYQYDHTGALVDTLLTEDQRKVLAAKQKPSVPKAGLAKVTAAVPVQEEEILLKTEPKVEQPQADGELNLESWLKGEEDYEMRDVQKVVKARYNKWCTKPLDILEFLVEDQKLVPLAICSNHVKSLLRPNK